MGADCQSCGNVPQEVNVRTYLRNKDFDFGQGQSSNKVSHDLLEARDSPHFSKFYRFGELQSIENHSSGTAEYAAIKFQDGSIYDGYIVNNKREGKGEQIWSDGSRYKG